MCFWTHDRHFTSRFRDLGVRVMIPALAQHTPITRILIANRGEIACRIIRTARAMGIDTLAVYSDADAGAPHMVLADRAVNIGPGPVGDSYLCVEKILDAARQAGADAIHPGYGFLSENADFAQACADAGLVFIGPPPSAITAMGNKAQAKQLMITSGVPCIPGYEGADQSDETLIAAGQDIGVPVMVKAAAGGGGRGMRFVHDESDLRQAIQLARSEGQSAFGSGELIIEKAILSPRHVEVQVFADAHGHCISLGERDCSVQRRHQKVLEEAPCPVMTPDLRRAMGEAAVRAAQSIDYVGAGTVEFLLDASGEFYFLEINTRLQVEHPVTELITGLDLVELQIRVARGEVLNLNQTDIQLSGHAVEARIYAEDPGQDFMPSLGDIALWSPPAGAGIRVDDGVVTGQTISPYYDAMVAKIIAHGETRAQAVDRLIKALRGTALLGVANNIEFLIACLDTPAFRAGEATTAFIAETFGAEGFVGAPVTPHIAAIAALVRHRAEQARAAAKALTPRDELMGWSSTGVLSSRYDLVCGDAAFGVTIQQRAGGRDIRASVDGRKCSEPFTLTLDHRGEGRFLAVVNGCAQSVIAHDIIARVCPDGRVHLALSGAHYTFEPVAVGIANVTLAAGAVLAPMPGVLVDVRVGKGDSVTAGDVLGVVEAMKMQHQLITQIDGTLANTPPKPGSQVAAGDTLFQVEER